RRDEDARRRGAGLLHRLGHVGEDRHALDVGAGLLGVGAGDDLGPVRPVAHAVEAALAPGEALVDDLGVLVDEDGHRSALPAQRAALVLRSARQVRSAHLSSSRSAGRTRSSVGPTGSLRSPQLFPASSTTFWAASNMVLAGISVSETCWARIARPSSALVP